jgi:hypothetical protein
MVVMFALLSRGQPHVTASLSRHIVAQLFQGLRQIGAG